MPILDTKNPRHLSGSINLLILGLEDLAENYPPERLSVDYINRLEAICHVISLRLIDSKTQPREAVHSTSSDVVTRRCSTCRTLRV